MAAVEMVVVKEPLFMTSGRVNVALTPEKVYRFSNPKNPIPNEFDVEADPE